MGKKGLLPSGYTQVEYIENTSTAYINTGVNGALSNSYEIKFSVTNLTAKQVVFGDWYPQITSQLVFSKDNNTIRYYVGDLDMCTIPLDVLPHIMIYNGITKTGALDGVSIGNVAKKTSGQVQYLFAANRSDVTKREYGKCRGYYCKMESNGEPVRNYIPCISPTNVVGMYDTVEGKFYSSPNGVAFVAGPVV